MGPNSPNVVEPETTVSQFQVAISPNGQFAACALGDKLVPKLRKSDGTPLILSAEHRESPASHKLLGQRVVVTGIALQGAESRTWNCTLRLDDCQIRRPALIDRMSHNIIDGRISGPLRHWWYFGRI